MAITSISFGTRAKSYNAYSDEQKELFLYLLRFKFLKAKPAAQRAGINPRTAQGSVKRMNEEPEWDIYGKLTNKVNRAGSQLQDEHKHFLLMPSPQPSKASV
ncbi:medium-chain fatty acid-CoA ligase faa2 [Mucor velutinosus]|uniref:Medium-chain fatty acid-CoA ligase faa2 n=1 Tax=Mucor velutinosus TaxID=708070 RepID=A0AAN7DBE2_9FUNG|nr:medium-chain fatty acid-CoA ligase faa2 [Mucor velutinosus]